MFYCEPCRVEREWPESLHRSFGVCEICGKGNTACWERPSSTLPRPRWAEDTSLMYDDDGNPIPAVPATPDKTKIRYDRLNQFLNCFTKEERAEWADTGKSPDWLLPALLWFMSRDPGHQELMKRLADS